MLTARGLLEQAVPVVLIAPLLLLVLLALPALFRRPLAETAIVPLTGGAVAIQFIGALVALLAYVLGAQQPQVMSIATWFDCSSNLFELNLAIDGFSLGFTLLCSGTCGVVAAFSSRYLHREAGFNRYFVQFALFELGITLLSLAGSIELQFAGWEFLGLSSALLVGFFHERRAPVTNALRVFATYRVGDAAMLGASVLLHHWSGSGALAGVPFGRGDLRADETQVFVVLLLLLIAVACKSALLPFSGWLPRAMEGPTPSSAVYYGALSIHAGCYLLIRAAPLLEQSPGARVCTVAVGALTALYATVVARVQTDVKSAIAYSALTQVALIVMEVGCGFTTLAFIHMLGHSCFRLLQLLASPNILHDLHELQSRLPERPAAPRTAGSRWRQRWWPLGASWRAGLYLVALERGFVDSLINRWVVEPFLRVVTTLDRVDRFLCGRSQDKQR